MINGDWIGNRIGDDTAMCVNAQGNLNNFDGSCPIADLHEYRCVNSTTATP